MLTPAKKHPSRAPRTSKKGTRIKPRPAAKAPLTVSRPELLVNGSDHDFRRLVQALLPFLAIHTAIRDRYAALLGLTGPQYTIMLCIRMLADAGQVNIRTVARHLWLSASFITAETNTLERKGYVVKARGDAADRRTVALTLTERGTALLDSIAPLRQRVNDVQFKSLSASEFRMIVPAIERLVQSGEQALALLDYLQTQHGEASGAARGTGLPAGAS
jgi:MarR family transcriptional regulator, organic hydroperoxide resistance regulator